ncbi:hypothetical protein E2562_004575 [Oryza meyeriana var. granulata]|uniref:Uncharacterized protein n=1 Tax=Oryza meyeriana var. granulata TaxID=110450 RepID=A0A6G1F3J3_9ORYZ|nr:hypothetical protein E2562_004575 [Oryza meyeriana var. granulata]
MMRVSVGGWRGGGGGRRLTLAPGTSSPRWSPPIRSKDLDGNIGESGGEFAGDLGASGAWGWGPDAGEVTSPVLASPSQPGLVGIASFRRRFLAPVKCFDADPLCAKSQATGSRFWALGNDESSEDETEVQLGLKKDEGKEEDGLEEEDFAQRAISIGFTVDEVLAAGENLLYTEPSPKASSCPGRSGERRNGKLAKRMVMAVAAGTKKVSAGKRWKGPLPGRRISPPRTFQHVLAAALGRIARKMVQHRG